MATVLNFLGEFYTNVSKTYGWLCALFNYVNNYNNYFSIAKK